MSGCAVAMWTNSRQSTARPVPLAAELGYLHPGGGSGERRGGYGRGEMPAGGEWRDNVAGWSGGPRPDDTRPTEEFSPLNYRGRRRVEGPMPEVMAGPPRQAVPRPVRPAPVSVPATGPETEPRGGRVLLTAAIVCVLLLVLTVWVRWPRDSGNAAPPDNGAEPVDVHLAARHRRGRVGSAGRQCSQGKLLDLFWQMEGALHRQGFGHRHVHRRRAGGRDAPAHDPVRAGGCPRVPDQRQRHGHESPVDRSQLVDAGNFSAGDDLAETRLEHHPVLQQHHGRARPGRHPHQLVAWSRSPVEVLTRNSPGVWPVSRMKNRPKFVASVKPSLLPIDATGRSVCASSRLASSVTRSSMTCFALRPVAARHARVSVRTEQPSRSA